jgi:hypothetical protein
MVANWTWPQCCIGASPLIMPDGSHARPRPLGYMAVENFLPVLHSPALGEIRVSREAQEQFLYRDSLLLARHDRPAGFDFLPSSATHGHLRPDAGAWVKDSTLGPVVAGAARGDRPGDQRGEIRLRRSVR